MFAKYIALCVVFFAFWQHGNAGVVKDPKLEELIEDMWEKVNEMKVNFIEYFINDIRNDTDIVENIADKLVNVLTEVSNNTQDYYVEIEKEARKSGTLNYTSPMMFVFKGLAGKRNEFSEVFKDIVRDAENMDEAMKQKFFNFIDKFVEWGLDCIDDVADIQKAYPQEFDVLEDAPDWDDIDDPIPSHYSPEVQATGRRIKKVVKRCTRQYTNFEKQLKKLLNEWVASTILNNLDQLMNELDTES